MTSEAQQRAFRLSRVHAEGWNAARRSGTVTRSGRHAEIANPYASEPERSRWNAGFASARPDSEGNPE